MLESLPAPSARAPALAEPAPAAPAHPKPLRRWAWPAASLFMLVLVGGLVYGRFFRAVDVPVVEAAQGAVAARVVGPGSVQARVAVTISARIGASVSQVHVDVGDPVRPGQLLVTLDDRDPSARRGVVSGQQQALLHTTQGARAALDKAQADLALARARQRRDAELLAQGFVSQAVLDASNAARDSAQAGVDAAQATLAARTADAVTLAQEARTADTALTYTRLVSPIEGVVIQRSGEAGTTVVPGTPLLKLVDATSLWVATRVDEAVIARVQPGQAARLRMRSGEVLGGTVARLARQSDAATRELDVFVAFDRVPQRFAIDQEAEVTIQVGEDVGVVVPLAALVRDKAGRHGVLLVSTGTDPSRTRFQPVETGPSDTRQVLIRRGLDGGEVVVANAVGMTANQRVQPVARTAAPR